MVDNSELLEIIKGARLIVKRLHKRQAFVMAERFEQVSRLAVRLCERRDLLLPAYRAEIMRLHHRYSRLLQEAGDRYPGVIRRRAPPVPKKAVLPPMPSESRTVHITLPGDQWLLISERIAAGYARSKADYFRQLHIREVNNGKTD